MEKIDKNKFKPIENITFEIIAINKSKESDKYVYDLKFNNYKTEKDVIVLNVNLIILNIIGRDLKTQEEINSLEVGKKYIFDIIPKNDITINTIRMLFLEMCYNVIDFLNPAIENTGRLKQIRVQSAPGLLMSIDGEAVRVGRSGIYEINNGISVSFIGFIVEPDDNKYFILDYQY